MKKYFKKFLLVLIGLISILGLTACDDAKTFYQIGFKTNGGNEIEPIKQQANEEIIMPNDPIKDGNNFLGWYLDDEFKTRFDYTKMPSKSFWLYAKWGVELSFDSTGGTKVASITQDPGSILPNIEAPSYGNNLFMGWYLDKEYTKKLGLVMPKKNTTVYAKWQALEGTTALDITNTIKIEQSDSFKLEKASDGFKVTATENKAIWDYFSFMLDFNVSSYNTIELIVEGSSGVNYMTKLEGGGAKKIEQARTLSGKEEKVYWTVNSENLTKTGGEKLLIFLNQGNSGCDTKNPEYIIIKSVKLYRHIDLNSEKNHAIFFNSNGGSPIAPIFAAKDATVVAPEEPTRPGYIFNGWFKDLECTDKFIFDKMPAGPTFLFAGWKESELVKITFDTDGGSTVPEIDIPKGSLTPEFTTPTKDGQIFVEWCLDKGCTIPFTDKTINESLKLYAHFIDPKNDLNTFSEKNLINGWTVNEEGTYNLEATPNSLKITTNKAKGTWSYIKNNINDDLSTGKILNIQLNGTNGQSMIIKFHTLNDKTFEFEVKFTGENQDLYYILPEDVDYTKDILIFVDGNISGADTNGTVVSIFKLATYDLGYSIDLTKYEEFIPELQFGYWNSGMGTGIYTNMKKFACTKQLTKENLPNGTIIVIEKGFTLTPDGFIDPSVKDGKGRPKMVSAKTKREVIIVNDEWWIRSNTSLSTTDLTMTVRCFNYSSVQGIDITNNLDYLRNGIRIYTPKAINK